jgi:dienelactone hydrolase
MNRPSPVGAWAGVGVLIALVAAGPAAAQSRVVDLAAADGLKLKASLFSASMPGPGVLLLHQCNRQRAIWNGLAQQLSAAGLHVLTMDLRGFGDSAGDRYGSASPAVQARQQEQWPADIDAAFHYLISQPNVTRTTIGVGGASCGVNNAIQTARRHPEVKSLVLLSGTTDLPGRSFLRNDRRAPALFSLADDDEFPQSVVTTQWLYSLTATPEKRLVHYATGGHGADMFAPHPELMKEIVDWFRMTLITSPGHATVARSTSSAAKESAALALIDEPGGPAKVAQQLADARRRDPKATPFSEVIVNLIGYEHLQSGDVSQAIAVFSLNVTAFPDSPNAYDSLADAYLAAGRNDLARINARKALELLPSAASVPTDYRDRIRESAEQKLKQLDSSR